MAADGGVVSVGGIPHSDVDGGSSQSGQMGVVSMTEGQKVRAWVGTKHGEGTITRVMSDGLLVVEFPDLPYPENMATPSGTYCVRPEQVTHVFDGTSYNPV